MEKLDLASLWIAEFIRLGADVEAVLARYDTEALGLGSVAESFKTGFEKVSHVYGREKGSPLSKDLEKADIRRDQCIIGIKGVAESYLRHYDPAFVGAADTLLQTINRYGNSIATQNYQTESESLRQLCGELDSPGAAKDALIKLGLNAWALEMRVANTDFSLLFERQNKEASPVPAIGNVKDLRIAAKGDYDALMAMMDARSLVSASPQLSHLIAELNTLIGKYNQLLASRRIFGGDDDAPLPPTP